MFFTGQHQVISWSLSNRYESELPAGDLDGSGPIDGDGLDALNIEEAMIKDIQGRQYRKNYQATAGYVVTFSNPIPDN